MKKTMVTAFCTLLASSCAAEMPARDEQNPWPYDPGPQAAFGRANPAQTEPEARVFDRLIGVHDCTQQRSNYATGEVVEGEGVWTWYHDMNGFGIRDIYRHGNSAPASQRIFNAVTKQWHVWYFVGQGFYYAGEWIGGGDGGRIVLEQPDADLGDKKVLSRLSFFAITENSYKWQSSNIDPETGEDLFVDWAIQCTRRQ